MATGNPPRDLEELGGQLDRLARRLEQLETQVEALVPSTGPRAAVKPVLEVAGDDVGFSMPAIFRRDVLVAALALLAIVIVAAVLVSHFLTGGESSQPWALPNADLANSRAVQGSSISSRNVSKLGVAWTMPLTATALYGTFAANPVTSPDGVVYLQDLDSNVFAVDLASGKVLWRHIYNSPDIGPNGVTYANAVVVGATAKAVFALDAKTGRELWRNTSLIPASQQKGGGELANGFGFDIQPQVANGHVYVSTGALLGGGLVYSLDAKTGRTLWSFDSVIDPVGNLIIGGGAWDAPAVGPDGTVYFGFGNMYQPEEVAVAHPSRRLYTDSTVALDGRTGARTWFFQAIPNDFYDWDLQDSPILTQSGNKTLVLEAGKMGYVYAIDAADGELVWKTKVGVHNGHDQDSALALHRKLGKLSYPLTVEPGVVGGVETNMAVADGVVYVPVSNLAAEWKTPATGIGSPRPGVGTGELLALDVATGRVLWDTAMPAMVFGDATVVNDLVFTTTFDGRLIALARKTGKIVWQKKLPAFTNAPLAIVGNTLITAASYPGGKGQTPEVIAFRLGAHGSLTPKPAVASTSGGTVNGAAIFAQDCSSCHTLAAAHATGAIGPNLDQTKPSAQVVARKVENGGRGMPAFGGRLSPKQIAAVAAFVSRAERKK